VERRSWSRIASRAALALILAGCAAPTGRNAAPSIDPSRATPTPAPTPTDTPIPTPEPSLPADAAPIELRGTWANREDTTNLRLLIQPVAYRITRSGNSGSGALSVTEDVIRFSESNLCPGIGEYRWTLSDGVLTLDPIAPDECPGRADGIEGISFVLLFPPS
jgi:hypothetical protein